MRDTMLILHFLGLAMGLGVAFAHMFLGIASSKMEKEEAEKFLIKTFFINYMGKTGLVLLIISGGALMTPYWGILSSKPLLMAKLSLVVVLTIMIGVLSVLSKKAAKAGGGEYLTKIERLGKMTLPIGIIIVILAVLTFH